jgi:hypothetical protein
MGSYATMEKSSGRLIEFPAESSQEALSEVLREGARRSEMGLGIGP